MEKVTQLAKQLAQKIKTQFSRMSQKELYIGIAVVAVIAAIVGTLVYFIYDSVSKVIYKPVAACSILTGDEAKELLGGKAIKSIDTQPVVSENASVSRCGYTNGVGDENSLIVAAITVRTAVNDDGIAENSRDFAAKKSTEIIDEVSGIGDEAFITPASGQLNILDGGNWIIASYGVGADPLGNVNEDLIRLGKLVVGS